MRNKKAQEFLNIVELIVFLFCAFFAFFFLATANNAAQEDVDQLIYDTQEKYQTLQQLRTLSQTPVEVQGKTMTFAQAANQYFELYDYLNTYEETLSNAEESRKSTQFIATQTALEESVKQNLQPFFSSSYLSSIRVRIVLFENDEASFSKELASFTSSNTDDKQTVAPTTVQFPAYFKHNRYPLGTYHIELQMVDEIDLGQVQAEALRGPKW